MEFRKVGATDLEVSVLTFGAWAAGGWMWGGTERQEAVAAIKAAVDHGMTSIDTAPIYGQGLSEEIVGEAIKGIPRDQVQILTKFGMRWDLAQGDFAMHSQDNQGNPIDVYKYAGRESIIKECEDSLRRLGTDYIDLYQIHWPDVTTPIQETFEAVAQLLKEGKIRQAGVSNYSVAQMQEAEKYVTLASNQVPYSMVHRNIEADVVPYCLENNKAILAYSPLERGLLTGKIKPGHHFNEGDHRAQLPVYQPNNLEKVNQFLDKIRPLAEDKNATLGQLVLRWTITQPGITIALVGARNAGQTIQNAKAMDLHLSPQELAFITSELDKLELA
ncbi:aldo/keto reductase [Rufibacter quisquiliarum]|uniref:Aryl-alcohol dehydrogenase-like predicted oxidoreductase n=1 Tax=Rufibacter quisquiliarum TaxID=1549639 RepID=A0A839GL09_9BACT|nr:aldo/keto reductase [Rufibacter quisquiliarum]MBA9075637.1 aryl-alcohol dehydrogenase-like predicted oxidoreductase [Rufibacter quisquiliarum]